MRLDHVSYVASHDQISDVVQRIGSQIGTAFVDGGIHPQFGTRNFTAPLLNGQYIEVVCALDHPAAEKTPFGQAVTKKAAEGGGWLTWVFSTDDLAPIEKTIGRNAIEGHRRLPSGDNLKWRQVGVKELLTEPELPFFIEWLSSFHPSDSHQANSRIIGLNFASPSPLQNSIFAPLIEKAISVNGIMLEILDYDQSNGLVTIQFETQNGRVVID
jgi:hypothetical protein